MTERAHDYPERSFLRGRAFTGPGDFNYQLQQWLALVNRRTAGCWAVRPTERIGADRQAMLTLPPVPRRWVGARRLGGRLITTSGWTPTITRCTPA